MLKVTTATAAPMSGSISSVSFESAQVTEHPDIRAAAQKELAPPDQKSSDPRLTLTATPAIWDTMIKIVTSRPSFMERYLEESAFHPNLRAKRDDPKQQLMMDNFERRVTERRAVPEEALSQMRERVQARFGSTQAGDRILSMAGIIGAAEEGADNLRRELERKPGGAPFRLSQENQILTSAGVFGPDEERIGRLLANNGPLVKAIYEHKYGLLPDHLSFEVSTWWTTTERYYDPGSPTLLGKVIINVGAGFRERESIEHGNQKIVTSIPKVDPFGAWCTRFELFEGLTSKRLKEEVQARVGTELYKRVFD
jgi:hypothetical protein